MRGAVVRIYWLVRNRRSVPSPRKRSRVIGIIRSRHTQSVMCSAPAHPVMSDIFFLFLVSITS
jgi:hypothetical protein